VLVSQLVADFASQVRVGSVVSELAPLEVAAPRVVVVTRVLPEVQLLLGFLRIGIQKGIALGALGRVMAASGIMAESAALPSAAVQVVEIMASWGSTSMRSVIRPFPSPEVSSSLASLASLYSVASFVSGTSFSPVLISVTLSAVPHIEGLFVREPAVSPESAVAC
jgi:hypothetical protein